MKTINQIKLLVEHLANSIYANTTKDDVSGNSEFNKIINDVRNNFLPLFQGNIKSMRILRYSMIRIVVWHHIHVFLT